MKCCNCGSLDIDLNTEEILICFECGAEIIPTPDELDYYYDLQYGDYEYDVWDEPGWYGIDEDFF